MLLDNFEDDLEFYKKDEERYGKIYSYLYERRERKYKNFMGEFQERPKNTRQELEYFTKNRISRMESLRRMNAPDVILDYEQKMLEELLMDIQKGNFLTTDEEKQYREKYMSRLREWEKYMDIDGGEEHNCEKILMKEVGQDIPVLLRRK